MRRAWVDARQAQPARAARSAASSYGERSAPLTLEKAVDDSRMLTQRFDLWSTTGCHVRSVRSTACGEGSVFDSAERSPLGQARERRHVIALQRGVVPARLVAANLTLLKRRRKTCSSKPGGIFVSSARCRSIRRSRGSAWSTTSNWLAKRVCRSSVIGFRYRRSS